MPTESRTAIRIEGAAENNLRDVTVDLPRGLTAIVGVSGSGKSSLAFETLYHEARRRFLETLSLGSPWLRMRPARVRTIRGLGPAVSLAQNVLNRNPHSTVASAAGIHPFLRLLYARFAERRCPDCGAETVVTSTEEQLAVLRQVVGENEPGRGEPVEVIAPLVRAAEGSHARLLAWLAERVEPGGLIVDGEPWAGRALEPDRPHDIAIRVATVDRSTGVADLRQALARVKQLGSAQTLLQANGRSRWLSRAALCPGCGRPFRIPKPEDFHTGAGGSATYRLGGVTLDELLALDVAAARTSVDAFGLSADAKVPVDQVRRRLDALVAVGLGYLPLRRPSPTLSRGEGQRLRIALLLANPIEDVIHVLDEPTIGLDPTQVGGVLGQIARLRGPVVMVEHDGGAVAAADHVIELGPGAGEAGGRVVFEGTPAALWRTDTPSGRWFSGREELPVIDPRPRATDWIDDSRCRREQPPGVRRRVPDRSPDGRRRTIRRREDDTRPGRARRVARRRRTGGLRGNRRARAPAGQRHPGADRAQPSFERRDVQRPGRRHPEPVRCRDGRTDRPLLVQPRGGRLPDLRGPRVGRDQAAVPALGVADVRSLRGSAVPAGSAGGARPVRGRRRPIHLGGVRPVDRRGGDAVR